MKRLFVILSLAIFALATNAQTDPALREELLKMLEADQKVREACAKGSGDEQVKCLAETLEKVDKPNTARLNEIINQYGFPTEKSVGKDGFRAFLTILQHTTDESLRQKSLKPITKAFKRKEIAPLDYANYVDRTLVRQGKPQLYGQNFEMKDNKLVMTAVEDRKNLDKRRRKIGLPTIEEYAAKLKEFYNLEVVIPPDN